MKTLRILAFITTLTTAAFGEGSVGFESADIPASVLKRQAGQVVELRLKSGDKIAGKVAAVGDKAVHLSALTGQEFYDAVVVLDDISAVVIRTGKK